MSIDHDFRKPSLYQIEDDIARVHAEQEDRQKRINNCEVEASDCALSMWAADAAEARRRCQLELARNDWKATFKALAYVSTGKLVHGKTWTGKDKFSFKTVTKWIIDGEWMPSYPAGEYLTPRKAKNLEKRGFKWIDMELDAHVASSAGCIGSPVFYFPAADDLTLITA